MCIENVFSSIDKDETIKLNLKPRTLTQTHLLQRSITISGGYEFRTTKINNQTPGMFLQ